MRRELCLSKRGLSVLIGLMAMAVLIVMPLGCGGGSSGTGAVTKLGITADSNGNTVTIFNAGDLSVMGTIPVSGDWPWAVIISNNGETAYVLNRDSDNISIISMSQQAEVGTIGLSGSAPAQGVIAPDGYLYVDYSSDNLLSKVMISGGTPAEAATIALSGTYYNGLDITPDGKFLYVGGFGGGTGEISKVDIAAFAETDYLTSGTSYLPDYAYDLVIDNNGIAYIGAYDEFEIITWDTNSDTAGSVIPLGVDEVANGMVVNGGKLFISNGLSYNTDLDNGALTIVDTDLAWSEYDYDYADDNSYDVTLPFSFGFMGATYTTVTFSSNGVLGLDGYYDYDMGVQDILGFAPNNEDLDSQYGYFNYSHRTFADHIVFQWDTSTNNNDDSTDGVAVFEAVMFDDNRVRFDYLFSMPGANAEVDTTTGSVLNPYPYGVGDGSGTAIVDLAAAYGSPFDLERRSFMWDPSVSTNSMAEVPFQWEGSGALHLPLVNSPRGIALTSDYIFLACPHTGYTTHNISNVVEVYDRKTLLPAGTMTVGDGPRGIAIQP